MTASLECSQLLETLQSRTRLLWELVSELDASRAGYVALDLDAIYRHVAAQTAICERLRGIGIDRELGMPAAQVDPALAARLRAARASMALAEQGLRQTHRAHLVLLDGMQRTSQMMANALLALSPVYSRPVQAGGAGTSRI
jgi:hypothetical protein